MSVDIEKTLRAAGINAESLNSIRLARGVVGKSSYVAGAIALVLLAAAIGLRNNPDYLLIDAVLAVTLFLAYFIGALWFAHKHPGEALLEGAELIQWRQLDIVAKDVPESVRLKYSESRVIGPRAEEG